MRRVLVIGMRRFPQCDAVKPFTTHTFSKKQHGFRKFEISNPVQTLCLSLASEARSSQASVDCTTASAHTVSIWRVIKRRKGPDAFDGNIRHEMQFSSCWLCALHLGPGAALLSISHAVQATRRNLQCLLPAILPRTSRRSELNTSI